MKKHIAIFILISNFFIAQNQRFSYQYQFVKDTLNKQEITNELMNLDILKEGSVFYSRDVYVSDSIMNAYFENQIKTTGPMNLDAKMMSKRKGSVKYKILKTYPDFKVFSTLNIGLDSYKVTDDRNIIWKIQPDQQKIGEFKAQKATTEFAGRQWVAWFSTELPFQDGPYKFHGLPGLIVKLEDRTKTHQFELIGVSKFTPYPENPSEFILKNKVIEINQKQYKKLFLENRNDPSKVLRQAVANGAIIQVTDSNGNNISTAEMIKNKEQSAKTNNLKDNNLIELDLLH